MERSDKVEKLDEYFATDKMSVSVGDFFKMRERTRFNDGRIEKNK